MEDNMMNPMVPDAGMCGCDREVFERVWRRVMSDDMEHSPVSIMPGSEQEDTRREPEQSGLALRPIPEPEPMRTSPMAAEPEALCLGRGSARYAPMLQEMVDGEAENGRLYQALTRRATGNSARMLGGLAADQRRHVRRLATAYFLITGERCQPQGQGGNRPVPDLMTGLREQFIQTQREAAAYQGAAAENSDPCLRQLFRELAQEKGTHTRMIRTMLEQM